MKEIKLTRGLVCRVDDQDFAWLNQWRWHAMPNGRSVYACRKSSSKLGPPKTLWMHKVISPDYSDHRDRDGLNNQRRNLRPATKSQNAANADRHSDNTSGFKGVIRSRSRSRWRAEITCLGKKRHLGVFGTKEEAARAYDIAAMDLFGEFAKTNF